MRCMRTIGLINNMNNDEQMEQAKQVWIKKIAIEATPDEQDAFEAGFSAGRGAWHPVKDGLPEKEGRYFVTATNPAVAKPVTFICDYEDGWDDEKVPGCQTKILAWMPLPEPFGGEKDGQ